MILHNVMPSMDSGIRPVECDGSNAWFRKTPVFQALIEERRTKGRFDPDECVFVSERIDTEKAKAQFAEHPNDLATRQCLSALSAGLTVMVSVWDGNTAFAVNNDGTRGCVFFSATDKS